jgi:hypothetical protein
MLHDQLSVSLDETAPPALRVTPDGGPALDMLTLRLLGAQRAAQRYAALGAAASDPVRRQILTTLAAGEARHAAACATSLRREVQRNPAALPGVLRVGLWAMRGADEPASPAPPSAEPEPGAGANADVSPARPREDRHYIRRMQGLYRLLVTEGERDVLAEEERPALRRAAAGVL